MSFEIVNIDLRDFAILGGRNKKVIGKYLRSVDIDQTNGTYITSEPLASPNCLTQYPLNPNNTSYTIKTVTTILGSLSIDFPLDVKYDYTRNRIWVADAGNSRVLILDSRDFSFVAEERNITLPHALSINMNTGNCFVKSYNSVTNGVVLEINTNGNIASFFEFSTTFPYADLTIQRNSAWIDNLPKTHSITCDNVHFKIWWTDGSMIYMANTSTNTVSVYDLSVDGFYGTSNITIEQSSGNAFLLASNVYGKWFVIQMNKYNSKFLGKAYVKE